MSEPDSTPIQLKPHFFSYWRHMYICLLLLGNLLSRFIVFFHMSWHLVFTAIQHAPLGSCFLLQRLSEKLWTFFNSGEETKSSHQFPALKETSQLLIVGSETKLFRNTFLKSTTKEMIPESIVLVSSGCFSGSYVWRRALLLLVNSWHSLRHSSYTQWQIHLFSCRNISQVKELFLWYLASIFCYYRFNVTWGQTNA